MVFYETPVPESGLPSRYEVRVLNESHIDWALAIVCHSNTFHSPLWTPIYSQKDSKSNPCTIIYRTARYLVEHQIATGLSLGVFDKEYKFKRPESEATGGALYWDLDDNTADGPTMLAQMDFPLVSVALALDAFEPLDLSRLGDFFAALPEFPILYGALGAGDQRDKDSWEPKALGEVVQRNATSTRAEYEGERIMKRLAHTLMHRAYADGFRGIQIECAHPAVTHVWSHPPEPYKGEVISKVDCMSFEHKEEDGTVSYPFRPAELTCTKVYVTLR
jgi:hypothetical protein